MEQRILFLSLSIIMILPLVSSEPNLEEANVMNLEKNGERFSVTLYHDDEGESGYVNWWQIETMEGEKLVRRKLLHSHGTRKFTRSDELEKNDKVSKIVVRGHDQTHGYGGRAAVMNLSTGEINFTNQGPEPKKFRAEEDETRGENTSKTIRGKEEIYNRKNKPDEESGKDDSGLIWLIYSFFSSIF